jgi:hypothetical protein
MTDLSRGARVRRGGRRPGWVLLTALLVLAIGASSALVFTNRAELLKLAVILALWAAVVAAFVSVIYRRQSDVDQARARDLKLVYDLQLDREISARREYELTVESQLRRELASELQAHSSDEVSALRAELAALRTNLEILFDAELSDRPALETERKTVQSDWEREHESARDRVNRVASVRAEEPARRHDDNSIIDVHEEPLVPPQPEQPYHPAYAYQPADAYAPPRRRRAAEAQEVDRGSHRRQNAQEARAARDEVTPPEGWAPPPASPAPEPPPPAAAERQSESRGWNPPPDRPSQAGGWPGPVASPAGEPERFEPQLARRSHRRPEPPSQPEPQFAPPQPPPEPPPQLQRPAWPPPAEPPRQQEPQPWQPVSPEGQWMPAGTPGSNWNAGQRESAGAVAWAYDNGPSRDKPSDRPPSAAEPEESAARRGRHSSAAAEQTPGQTGDPVADWTESGRRAPSRHSTEFSDSGMSGSATPAPAMSPPPPPPPPPPTSPLDRDPAMSPPPPPLNARHRGTDPLSEADDPQSGGQSVAELLARLQTAPSEGGRRRRRED